MPPSTRLRGVGREKLRHRRREHIALRRHYHASRFVAAAVVGYVDAVAPNELAEVFSIEPRRARGRREARVVAAQKLGKVRSGEQITRFFEGEVGADVES